MQPSGPKALRPPKRGLRPENLHILVDNTPPSLDHRIAACCKASWSWLISAGVHALLTLALMLLVVPPDMTEPLLLDLSQAENHEPEFARPVVLEQMSFAAPSTPVSAGPVGMFPMSDAAATWVPPVNPPDAHAGFLPRRGGPTHEASRVIHNDQALTRKPAQNSIGTRFFGIEAKGKRFVFVVDSSDSMKWSKWRRACRELVASIESLGPDQYFCVYFFDSVPHLMFNQRAADLQLVQATPGNIRRVRRWMTSISFGDETRPFLAVRHALSLRPDAVFLLSDGEFHDATLTYFRVARGPRTDRSSPEPIVVHTIGFKSRVGQDTLRQIADHTGGTYRFIP